MNIWDEYGFGIVVIFAAFLILFIIAKISNPDRKAQRALDLYLKRPHSAAEIGRFYERYIGYLYEREGFDVIYHGAVNRFADLGRDLIVKRMNEVLVIQTKCWARFKLIPEKHIFQLYGSMSHYKLTSEKAGRPTRAVFYTTARFTNLAKDAAQVLGVELRTEEMKRSYPMIKCKVFPNGEKFYHLPMDSAYDTLKIDIHKGEFFARTVKEAVAKGFRRAGS